MMKFKLVNNKVTDEREKALNNKVYRRNHKSPNSAQSESACAGALGVQLAGDAWYFGELYHKPTIGDALRPVEPEDIPRANRLMYTASVLTLAVCTAMVLFICREWGGWIL